MDLSEQIVVFITAPDSIASELARNLVQERFVACVNLVSGIRSIYRWQGKVCEDQEVLLIAKTIGARFNELKIYVSDNHPYDVPEIIALPIVDGHTPYLDWIINETRV